MDNLSHPGHKYVNHALFYLIIPLMDTSQGCISTTEVTQTGYSIVTMFVPFEHITMTS